MAAMKQTMEMSPVSLGALFHARRGGMVTLVAGDTELVAHRAVLAARSPVFAAMFGHDTLEASSGQVDVEDVEGPVLQQLLQYLYTLQAPQEPGTAPQLLAAADKYGVSALKSACEQQLVSQLAVENAAASAVLAVRHSCPTLKQAAVSFIRAHTHQVMGTDGWLDAMFKQPADLAEVSRLLAKTPSDSSAPPPAAAASGPSGSQATPAAAPAPPTAAHLTPPLDEAAVSRYRSLSALQKAERLMEAAAKGSEGDVRALLAAGADMGAVDRDKLTALHYAAMFGHAAVVRLLAAASADLNCRDRWGRTPLHLAVFCCRTEAAAALLQLGADRAARDRDGDTPLDRAKNQQMVELLSSSSLYAQQKRLRQAAKEGSEDEVMALLAAGADVWADDDLRQTVLHYAALRGHVAVLRVLAAASADINCRDDFGWTPLHWAAHSGQAEAAAALLQLGADRKARNNMGRTPLEVAKHNERKQLVKLLSRR